MSAKESKRTALPLKWQICTEGFAEACYLTKYIRELGLSKYVIVNCKHTEHKGCGRQHEALLNKMQECGRKWSAEKVFLVHDYDKAAEHHSVKSSFNKTFERASKESGYYVIYSNPCFEFWLLLHTGYRDSDLHRHVYQKKVKEICNQKRNESGLPILHGDDYKTDPMLFEYFGGLEGAHVACNNAKKRFDKESKTGNDNGPFSTLKHASNIPCSNMFELLYALEKFATSLDANSG